MLNTLDGLIDTVRGSLCLFSDFYQMYAVTYYNYIILYSYILNNQTALEASILFSIELQAPLLPRLFQFFMFGSWFNLAQLVDLKGIFEIPLMHLVCGQ